MRRDVGRRPDLALRALVAEGFLSRLSFGIIGFTLPLYAHHLGLSLAQIGLLASLNTVVALALKPVMGAVADRFGCRRSLLVAMTLRSGLSLLYALTTLPAQLYGVRGVHGLADAVRDPAVKVLIAEHGGKKAIAQSFAWYQTARTVAGSVGKSAAGLLLTLTAANYGLTFLAASALSLLPVVIVAGWVREVASGPEAPGPAPASTPATERPAPDSGALAPPRRRPSTVGYVVFGFLVSGSASMLGTLFPVLATEYAGLTQAQAGALYLVTPFLAVTGPVFGWLSDRVSRSLVLSVRSVANVCSSLLYLAAPGFPGFAVGKSLDDLGKAAFSPAWGSMMAEVSGSDRRRRARIISQLSAGEDAGDVVAPIVAGLVWSAWGIPAVLALRAALAVAAEAQALWLAHRGRAPKVAPRHRRSRRRRDVADGPALSGRRARRRAAPTHRPRRRDQPRPASVPSEDPGAVENSGVAGSRRGRRRKPAPTARVLTAGQLPGRSGSRPAAAAAASTR
jgi:MFS family permease